MEIKELIVGQWYEVPDYNLCFKYGGMRSSDRLIMTEYYKNFVKQLNDVASNPDIWNKCVILNNYDLKKYLPASHPDLQTENKYEL